MDSTIRPRRMWTKQEDETLRRIAEAQALACNGIVKDWCAISKLLPGRTNKDCRKRYSKVTKSVNKGTWSPAEDQRLVDAMATIGPSWQLIAEKVGTRHAEQCAKRWQHSLDPTVDRSEWTEQENKILVDAVQSIGRSWRSICKTRFPSRSTTDIKNHYEYVIRHSKAANKSVRSSCHQTTPPSDPRDGSSVSSEDMMPMQYPVVTSHPSVHNRTEHILTGCHPAPNTFANFDLQSSLSQGQLAIPSVTTSWSYAPQNFGPVTSLQSPLDYGAGTYGALFHHRNSVSTMVSGTSQSSPISAAPQFSPISPDGALLVTSGDDFTNLGAAHTVASDPQQGFTTAPHHASVPFGLLPHQSLQYREQWSAVPQG